MLTIQRPATVAANLSNERLSRVVLEVLAVAGLLALCAQVRILLPFTPVPVTLQTLAVLALPFAIVPGRAMAGALLYAALGLAGVPIFAIGFGPTFGYILGFAAAVPVVARFQKPAAGIFAGQLTIYALGIAWLSLWSTASPLQTVLLGILPFLPADALKMTLAYAFARWMKSARQSDH